MESADAVQQRTRELARLLEWTRPLAIGLVKEFFIEDHWSKVPHSWRAPLENLSLSSLAELLESPPLAPPPGEIWPLSLLAFLNAVHTLRLPGQLRRREPEGARSTGAGGLSDQVGLSNKEGGSKESGALTKGDALVTADGRCLEGEDTMDRELRRAVKPKKMHEITRLTHLVDALATSVGCDVLVDVGSGQGYLSRSLAFERNWSVVAVEAVNSNVVAAKKLDSKAEKGLRYKMRTKGSVVWQPGVGSVRNVSVPSPTSPYLLVTPPNPP